MEPHLLSAMDGSMAICANCKRDLREAQAVRIGTDALSFQLAADQVVRAGRGPYGITQLHSTEWFALSRYFVALLRKTLLGKSQGLVALAKELGVDMETMATPATGLPLELLPVHERASLLAGAWRMLEAGPGRFLDAAMKSYLLAPSLHERRQPVPACIDNIISALPGKGGISRNRDKQPLLTPRSRQAVIRMWARLLRKIR